ncbi:MAG TPA: dihydroxyacetone kinase subunit DhaK, partial [Anaerolineae bacterium]|nr:dihydroxyacetone kinase subunit DhaK [Anaerolineae bacterium]
MKKILNDPFHYVDEMLEGLCAAHPQYYQQRGPHGRVIARAGGAVAGKVGLVTGGGSGHLPVFTGYVGKGLLDACAIGDVFASPTAEQMSDAIEAANGGAGVLLLYGNYGGDVMNFDMAAELVGMEGIATETVLAADDVA